MEAGSLCIGFQGARRQAGIDTIYAIGFPYWNWLLQSLFFPPFRAMPDFSRVVSHKEVSSLIGNLKWRCIICQMPGYVFPAKIGAAESITETTSHVLCSRCGEYSISYLASVSPSWRKMSVAQIANISGYLRENHSVVVNDDKDISFLANLSTPPVAAKALKLLSQIANRCPIPGSYLEMIIDGIDPQMDHFRSITSNSFPSDSAADKAALDLFPCLSFAWAQNQAELRFLLIDYLIEGASFLSRESQTESPTFGFKITAKGWEQLQMSGSSDSSTGFVAMWFDNSMVSVWEEGFYPAIAEAGYFPLRIDKKDHNNKIDDEIIASIRGAKFVVADFTGHRGGVYYEAGFAGGLGKPVIWCVRDADLPSLHFDTRQFNHIVWSNNDLGNLRRSLKARIEATLGKGPHKR